MGDNKQDKRYKSEKKVRNRVDKYKSLRKKKRKGFHRRRKTSSAIINSKPPNSAPASASSRSVTTTTNSNVTDYDETPSVSAVIITRTNDEEELPDFADNNKSILEKKQGSEVTFSPVKIRKRKR